MGLIIITPDMHQKFQRVYPTSLPRQTGGTLRIVLLLLALSAALVGSAIALWLYQPLRLNGKAVELSIESGDTPRAIAQAWVDAGVKTPAWALYNWFRLSGQDRQIRAGSYELAKGATPRDLLRMMVRGDERLSTVKLIEGWTFKRFRAELAQAQGLKPTTAGLKDENIMAQLGMPGVSAEGQFFPDTYSYAKGSTDLAVMRRALHAMERQLDAVWTHRAPDLAVHTPQDVLILASIVEKETGKPADRAKIAAVFHNRLRIGMPLQTDPTVIYGIGERYDGNLRRIHLQADGPYNTYLRPGLPPTPIAMPGKAALMATVKPADIKALYFVARGDGSSAFSESLTEHNRAVNQYQRTPRPAGARP
jgi:UPF0755 protein